VGASRGVNTVNDFSQPGGSGAAAAPASAFTPEQAARARAMVERQLRAHGIRDPRVLAAMAAVPRHAFVPPELQDHAYDDQPLPIGEGQTISQPFMVAAAAEALELTGSESVLEIGAGSGYQSAVLSLLAREVRAVEIHANLAAASQERLARLGFHNAIIRVGDGTLGCPEAAPFDAILVSAAAPEVPEPLIDQLAEGGRLVVPAGSAEMQSLLRVRRRGGQMSTESLFQCRFVPLVGRFGWSGDNFGG